MIVGGFAFAVALIWSGASEDQAIRVLAILSATALASILLVMWMLFFSRLAKRTRLVIFGGLVGVAVLFSACFRFSQFSGNMMPLFEWRWAKRCLLYTSPSPRD